MNFRQNQRDNREKEISLKDGAHSKTQTLNRGVRSVFRQPRIQTLYKPIRIETRKKMNNSDWFIQCLKTRWSQYCYITLNRVENAAILLSLGTDSNFRQRTDSVAKIPKEAIFLDSESHRSKRK